MKKMVTHRAYDTLNPIFRLTYRIVCMSYSIHSNQSILFCPNSFTRTYYPKSIHHPMYSHFSMPTQSIYYILLYHDHNILIVWLYPHHYQCQFLSKFFE